MTVGTSGGGDGVDDDTAQRIVFSPIADNYALVVLPHVWVAYFRLFEDPGRAVQRAVVHAVQAVEALPLLPDDDIVEINANPHAPAQVKSFVVGKSIV